VEVVAASHVSLEVRRGDGRCRTSERLAAAYGAGELPD
jgi:hypothetical protein